MSGEPLEVAMMASGLRACAPVTLAAMFGADEIDVPVRAVVCGPDAGFLGPWASDARVRVELLGAEAWAAYQDYSVNRRIAETFRRCVEGAAERGRALVLTQDDVVFAEGWLTTTRYAARVARLELSVKRQLKNAPIVLALFAPAKFKRIHSPLAPYLPHCFYGNQGVYFSAPAVEALLPFANTQPPDQMDDMVVNQFVSQHKAHLFAINPNVVQHAPPSSTHGGALCLSPTFDPRGHRL